MRSMAMLPVVLAMTSMTTAQGRMEQSNALVDVEAIALPLQRVAFGSCNHQDREQPLWSTIRAREPQLWVWMGDAIYGDYKAYDEIRTYLPPFPTFRDAPPEMLVEKYAKQLGHPEYQELRARVPIIGVWDDHDYGLNDGGKTYKYREASQQIFLDFLGEPPGSSRREQEGVFASYTIGKDGQAVKFILLDVRYNKDAYEDARGDFLGEKQWQWLEDELTTSTASFHVIVSGVQILPDDRVLPGENWARFPYQRRRLLNLLLKSNAKGVILLSGDVHFAEINQVQCSEYRSIITEITSSGMTHSWGEANWFDAFIFQAANLILPWPFRPHHSSVYGHKNFGEIEFDWTASPLPTATVQILGEDGQTKLRHVVSSHYLESDANEGDPSRSCRAIQEVSMPVLFTRQILLLGCVGLLIGGLLAALLACVYSLVVLYKRSFAFMANLQHRLFDGYEKLD
ncbi:hypothetical protein Poli38472_002358 [Pythium oligandrum]|uniref:PhoD-like phosphatase metallophosphatase domain-containing protein n=1 Tax=Pythium oligandrum TaxID=41045 RepID=A0A8K1CJL6_PYTOL|nr:hypothetical protein Poli38472_002358 [Pythium oligandrum]|eukprot:TMW63417.1 hypothetical protein Poli38472_002358 [Pythium oligandrum]